MLKFYFFKCSMSNGKLWIPSDVTTELYHYEQKTNKHITTLIVLWKSRRTTLEAPFHGKGVIVYKTWKREHTLRKATGREGSTDLTENRVIKISSIKTFKWKGGRKGNCNVWTMDSISWSVPKKSSSLEAGRTTPRRTRKASDSIYIQRYYS